MVKICNEYYMIDAIIGGNIIRKRKYRKEISMISYKWYDYDGIAITNHIEISRLDSLATPDSMVDESYDEHASFMKGVNNVSSVAGIPMTGRSVVVSWNPSDGINTLGMKYDKGFEGDSYYIVVVNTGNKPAILYAPKEDEPTSEDDTINVVPLLDSDSIYVNVTGDHISLSPGQYEAIRMTFAGGKQYWEMRAEISSSNVGGITIGDADYVTFRYLWEGSSGRDLDTATGVDNSGIPGMDGKAVGFGQKGNNDPLVGNVLKWGGDNTGSGKECALLSISYLRDNYNDILPDKTNITAYATWFGNKGTGNCSFEVVAYKGGTMRQEGYNFVNTGGEILYQRVHDFVCDTVKGSDDYVNKYTRVAKTTYDKTTGNVYLSTGTSIDQEEENSSVNEIIKEIQKDIDIINVLVSQSFVVELDHIPGNDDKQYLKDGVLVDFKVGAIVKYGSVFNNSGDVSLFMLFEFNPYNNDSPIWIRIFRDMAVGEGSIKEYDQGVYHYYYCNTDYDVVHVVSGSKMNTVLGERDFVFIVNKTGGDLEIVFNYINQAGSPDGIIDGIIAPFGVSSLFLPPKGTISLAKVGQGYYVTGITGVTIFPDLSDTSRIGEWVMSVSPYGTPSLSEVVDIKKWDESVVEELNSSSLNTRYPDVPVGFSLVCKTIGKVYEKANSFNEWISYDIKSV